MKKWIAPWFVTLVGAALLVVITVQMNGGDPLALARIGLKYSGASASSDLPIEDITDPAVIEGYDGQFVYFIAMNPSPAAATPHLDVPAYRYQRILLPLLARALAIGNEPLIPWTIALVGVLSLAGGTWAVQEMLAGWGVSRWYALVYGFWAGFMLALVVDLPEPLAYGLAAGAFLALERGRRWVGWLLLGLAVFAKETTVLFSLAVLLAYMAQRRWSDVGGLAAVAILPFVLFQAWLWAEFGSPGIGSGGAMAMPFEVIPYMGLLRIGYYSLAYLAAMSVVFGPAIVLPSLWGVWKSTKFWLRKPDGERNMIVAALFLNALVIAFTPFSTFRETGGIIRFASGLVLAMLLFAGRYRQRRVLNYSALWLVLNLFLVK